MKCVFKHQLDNLLKRDTRTLKYVEVTYDGINKIQFSKVEHINWNRPVLRATVVFEEIRYEYAGYYEDVGLDYDNSGPILIPRNKVKIRPRKMKENHAI